KTQKNEVKFSEFGITKFNLVVFTISQWDLVLQSSIMKQYKNYFLSIFLFYMLYLLFKTILSQDN
ncbi:hypothetical protein, partial [Holdemanella biformis]